MMNATIDISNIDDLKKLRETIDLIIFSLATPMELLAIASMPGLGAGESCSCNNSDGHDILKSINRQADETILRLKGELHPEERKIVDAIMQAWEKHAEKIVSEVSQLVVKQMGGDN